MAKKAKLDKAAKKAAKASAKLDKRIDKINKKIAGLMDKKAKLEAKRDGVKPKAKK